MDNFSSQTRTVAVLVAQAAVASALAVAWTTHLGRWSRFAPCEKIALVCLCTLFAFWLTYFLAPLYKIGTLRAFLDKETFRLEREELLDAPATGAGGEPSRNIVERNTALQGRALANIVSQSAFMTVVALFFGPILNDHVTPLTSFQIVLKPVVAGLAVLTVTLSLWSIDLLDTAQNVFHGSPGRSLYLRGYFFREIGVFVPRGGASCRFYAFAFLSVFLISAVSYFEPRMIVFAVTAFFYIGYPILFGYKVKYVRKVLHEAPIDRTVKWPTFILSGIGVVLSAYIWIV